MLTCIIVDDEPLAISLISDYVHKTEGLRLLDSFSNPIGAVQFCNQNSVDLVFLDVQMPELTGIQFMNIFNNKTHFILTTAYSDYALAGYEFNIIDYLLKPITLGRFIIAINKAKERIQPKPIVELLQQQMPIPNDFIFVKTEYKVKKINLVDILYFEGFGDYVNIQTLHEKILSLENIKSFAERLPNRQFIRVHKSYIVPIKKIEFIEKKRIIIQNKYIPIGGTYQNNFWKIVNGKK